MKIINASDLKLYIMRHLLIDEDSTTEEIERQMLRAIDVQPAIDAKVVRHGRWIHERTEGGFHIWRCNQCGRGMNANPEGTDLYCYHCGAKMDEVSE